MAKMGRGSTVRDNRTGQFRKAAPHERNSFYQVDTLSKGLANFMFKTSDEMMERIQDFQDEVEQYMKDNAPWEDQSGQAREGLTTELEADNDQMNLTLMHTVDYGIWLEIRWGGRYAIIIPTVEAMGPKLMRKFEGICSEIEYP
jgi:gas vesicle protein